MGVNAPGLDFGVSWARSVGTVCAYLMREFTRGIIGGWECNYDAKGFERGGGDQRPPITLRLPAQGITNRGRGGAEACGSNRGQPYRRGQECVVLHNVVQGEPAALRDK